MSSAGISWNPLSTEQRSRRHPHPASSRSPLPGFSRPQQAGQADDRRLTVLILPHVPSSRSYSLDPVLRVTLCLSGAELWSHAIVTRMGTLAQGTDSRVRQNRRQGREGQSGQRGLAHKDRAHRQSGVQTQTTEPGAERSAVPEQSGDFLRAMLGLRPGSPVSWGDPPLGVPGWAGTERHSTHCWLGAERSGGGRARGAVPTSGWGWSSGGLGWGAGRPARTAAAADVTGS